MGNKDKVKKASTSGPSSSTNVKAAAPVSAAAVTKAPKMGSVASTTAKQNATTSEIDDIFAGKKSLPAKSVPEASTSTSNTPESKSSKKKKRKLQDVEESVTSATNTSDVSKIDSTAVAGNDTKGKGKSITQDGTTASNASAVTVVEASSIPGLVTSDPSKKRRKSDKSEDTSAKSKSTAVATATTASAKEDDELFRDSRGTSNSESFYLTFTFIVHTHVLPNNQLMYTPLILLYLGRKTDDGLPIYDIKELNIGLGGDTELCPFDCQCCF